MLQRSTFAVGILSDGWFGIAKTAIDTKIDEYIKKINMLNVCKVAFNSCNSGRCVNFREPNKFIFFFSAIEKTKSHKIGADRIFTATALVRDIT